METTEAATTQEYFPEIQLFDDNDVNIFPGYTSSGPWRSTFQPDFGVIIITHGLPGIGWKILDI